MAATECDLLFGLIALQVGLIDQGQLVAAFQASARDKCRSIADHLVARGDLDVADRDAVNALVTRHLAKHYGDPEQSVAALQAGRLAGESLTKLGDPAIAAALDRLGFELPGERECTNADATLPHLVTPSSTVGPRFRVIRPYARGGLGAVFVAMDEELHREVALKQILDEHADDPLSRQRFVLEAEITGGLEHPGIVPVYALGAYHSGRPYYAMRFVRGDSLKDAIERFHTDERLKANVGARSLELRELLRRFVDVCNAIHYAHSRGVLHRDIKPGNVIVGRFGETLVVDWGLAKATGRSDPIEAERTLHPSSGNNSAETLPGSVIGTPAYMSPEQATGDLDRLGPASDVYSLGATLYCLLTGKPPFEGNDLGMVLKSVHRGEFPPPRSLDPSLDQALEAVCLKAMALKPQDRYQTPRSVAEDIERWMADEPVSAWREPALERVRRWVRRNRQKVITFGAVIVMALAGLAAVAVVEARANRDLRVANARTLSERDQARQNFDLARKAVDDYLTRVGQNPVLKEQGLHDLRRELLESALGYYRNFLRLRGDDQALRSEVAAAHERVGVIQIELGQAREALASYDHALTLIEPLVRDRPGDPATATARVRLHAGRLQALRDIGVQAEALAAFDQTAGLGEAHLSAGGGTGELYDILARTYDNAGFVLRGMGRTDDALHAALRSHALAEKQVQVRPDDPIAACTLVRVTRQAGSLLELRGQPDEARRLCQQSIAFGKVQVRDHPGDVEMRMHLANLEFLLGFVEKNSGHRSEALHLVRSAADTLGALARENHVLIRVRSSLGNTLNNLSQLQTDDGQYDEARKSALAVINIFESLAREVPSTPYFRIYTAYGYASLGKARLKAGSNAEALATLAKAIAILEQSSDSEDLYNLACNLALSSSVADPAEGTQSAIRQRRAADLAVAALRRAIALGFANAEVLKNDPDFDSIQSRPDFQALLFDLAFPADPFARAN